jgi:16S rRNA (adenine1518-N6/adenine1519-N6)-dimethyltransferase
MKKSRRHALGQHFLKNPRILKKIIDCISPNACDTIVEVGAGEGHLTALLAEKAQRIIAVEKDPRLIPGLRRKRLPNVSLLEADVLSVRFRDITPIPRVTVVGNLPYAISTPFLFKLVDEREAVQAGYFLLQKEVAERICSPPGSKKYGPLTILLQNYFEPRILFSLGPGAFSPPPRVDSALLSLTPRAEPLAHVQDVSSFRRFLHDLFLQRRKTLGNNLKRLGLPSDEIAKASMRCAVDIGIRPEQLSLDQVICLYKALSPLLTRQ